MLGAGQKQQKKYTAMIKSVIIPEKTIQVRLICDSLNRQFISFQTREIREWLQESITITIAVKNPSDFRKPIFTKWNIRSSI